MEYWSTITHASISHPGVEYTIQRMSLGRRIDLGQRVRELGLKLEFLQAGQTMQEQVEAGVLQNEIDRLYLQWGLLGVTGLRIDGVDATPPAVVDRGPEALTKEILEAIKRELDLSEDERKNS